MKKIATVQKTAATFLLLLVGLASVAGAAGGTRQKLYILNSVLDTMTVVDVASNRVIGRVTVGLQPHGLAWPKSQSVLWVSAEGSSELVKVDTIRDEVLARYPIGRRPNEIDVTSDGRLVFIPAMLDGVYQVFDTEAEEIIATFPTDGMPHNAIVSADDRFAYFSPMDREPYYTEEQARTRGIPTSTNDKVYILDIEHLALAGTIALADAPRPITIHPKGHRIYVNRDGLLGFEVLDIQSRRQIYTAHFDMTREERATPSRSHAIGVTPDGREVWSTDINNGVVHVFDVTTDKPKQVARMKTGQTPLWLTITPDSKTVYVSNTADDSLSVFDVASKKEVTRIQLEKGNAPKRSLVVEVPTV